ncbi:hemolysin family protein [Paenibacillus daejeonensis]|uniref:hemolysin family protein n=1 Tax=Paenibacillus daejeonensis TaxID=135193 RepID=UPI000370B6AF|nr:hemolysin family protein [Paenibacillus daejeonensis]
MDISIIINLGLVAILIGLTAFFVGSEFAVVKVRMSRIEQLVTEGNKKAIAAKRIVTNLDYYLSACQLGITVTALGLGALGEPTIEKILHPIFDEWGLSAAVSTFISFALALSIMTFLHVVIGELAPKTLAIQFAERMTLMLSRPLVAFGTVLFPLIWLLNGSAQVLLRMFGVKPAGHEQAHSEEELKIIMTQSFQSGEINQTELAYMQNIFAFDERVAKDVMVPRTQIIVVDSEMSPEEFLQLTDEHRYTRYPVTEDSNKDNIIGFLNAKELVTHIALNRLNTLKEHIHDIYVIHETTPLHDALVKMQKNGVHMALVIDEYGGTAGIITMEDILEEIVGEIRDEFDEDEVEDISEQASDEYLINGRVLLSLLEERFGISFENSENVDTIGGWLQIRANLIDGMSEPVDHGDHRWYINESDNHQILSVTLKLNVNVQKDADEESENEN